MTQNNWEIRSLMPALFILLGAGKYVFNKYVSPVSKSAIRDMNAHSLSGSEGDKYDPNWGLWMIATGVLMFFLVNGIFYLRGMR